MVSQNRYRRKGKNLDVDRILKRPQVEFESKLEDAIKDLKRSRKDLLKRVEYIDSLIELLPRLEQKHLEALCHTVKI